MKLTVKTLRIMLMLLLLAPVSIQAKGDKNNLRLLYWNIQNGMWDGQPDNYTRFVAWVKAQKPDVCVWCEAQSIWVTNSDKKLDKKDQYLVANWDKLARRYGHKYTYLGGHHDNYPQVITSKYPIHNVARLLGSQSDTLVCHGGGWATIEVNGKTVNIVTVHTWPQAYGYGVSKEDRPRSIAAHEGDHFRRTEMEYIINHTIGQVPGANQQLWMMMGDFNAPSPVDNSVYNFPKDDTRFLTHKFIIEHSPYIDVVKQKNNGIFIPSSVWNGRRIDFVYATKALYDRVKNASIIWDQYTTPVRNAQNLGNFWHPSDHLPIIVNFDMK
ncbi:MAG: endonuclease [Bacteroidaceae bacterium]|nr:endonuclease [Bacteroidaceae bacterium]